MICCVSSDAKLQPQTLIALDYCHKIKCYFNGFTEDDVKGKIMAGQEEKKFGLDGNESGKLREIGLLFEQFWGIRHNLTKRKNQSQNGRNYSGQTESIKEKALEMSRSCEYASGGSHSEVKRLVSVLLKEIENFIAEKGAELS